MQDHHVLLVSNRREQARHLASAITLVLPCRLVEPGTPWPPGRMPAVVIDLAGPQRDSAWVEAAAASIRAGSVPCLYVARNGEAPDAPEIRRFGMPTLIPAGARSNGIVSTLLKTIAEGRAAEAARTRLENRVEAATTIVAGLLDAAASGIPPRAADAEDGTEIVLSAVSEAGIRAWLDRLRQHHIGLYQHSLSVAGFAAAFAVELSFSAHDRHKLAQSALLHDVGKARIPVAVLDKPGPLTPEETRVMREHPAIGADILAQAGGFDPAILDVVRHHHERLDGSGYPDGLRCPAISDLVRLVAICDVHSALTERRAYRPALSAPQAWRIMEGMAGQLDADLLRAYAPVAIRAGDDACRV